jgi:hypothetical protein
VEGHRSPRRWRDYSGGATGAKRLGVRQSAGALKMRVKKISRLDAAADGAMLPRQ